MSMTRNSLSVNMNIIATPIKHRIFDHLFNLRQRGPIMAYNGLRLHLKGVLLSGFRCIKG